MSKLGSLFRAREVPEVDPKVFGDEIAEKVSWKPVGVGGSNFKTHFMEEGDGRIVLKATVLYKCMSIIPFIFSVLFAYLGYQEGKWWLYGLSILTCLMFIYFLKNILRKKVFDKGIGLYWEGRNQLKPSNRSHDFSDIYAVQLLEEYCESSSKNRAGYMSYEINLVMSDLSRINVIDHGDLDAARRQAQSIGKLAVSPVWDATFGHAA